MLASLALAGLVEFHGVTYALTCSLAFDAHRIFTVIVFNHAPIRCSMLPLFAPNALATRVVYSIRVVRMSLAKRQTMAQTAHARVH